MSSYYPKSDVSYGGCVSVIFIPLEIISSGYLTITGYDQRYDVYKLGFPNEEVRYGFLNFLMPYYMPVENGIGSFQITKFCKELEAGETAGLFDTLPIGWQNIGKSRRRI